MADVFRLQYSILGHQVEVDHPSYKLAAEGFIRAVSDPDCAYAEVTQIDQALNWAMEICLYKAPDR